MLTHAGRKHAVRPASCEACQCCCCWAMPKMLLQLDVCDCHFEGARRDRCVHGCHNACCQGFVPAGLKGDDGFRCCCCSACPAGSGVRRLEDNCCNVGCFEARKQCNDLIRKVGLERPISVSVILSKSILSLMAKVAVAAAAAQTEHLQHIHTQSQGA